MIHSSTRTCAKPVLVCRWILSLLKRGPQSVWVILRRLFYRWGFTGGWSLFSLTIGEETKIEGSPQRRPSLPSGDVPRVYHVFDDDKPLRDASSAKEGSLIVPDHSYTILDEGETIPLDHVACSAFPLPNRSIRNPSQSSINLEILGRDYEQHLAGISRSPAVLSRSPYRSSIGGSSVNHIIVSIEEAEGTTSHTRVETAIRESTPIPEIVTQLPTSPLSEMVLPNPGDAPVGKTTQSSTSWWLNMAHISPATPFATPRYSDRPTIYKYSSNITVDPLTVKYEEPRTPIGWTLRDHPEGARYFYHSEKRIFTDADIFDEKILHRANEDIKSIDEVINECGDLVPKNRHLVIDLHYVPDSKDDIQTEYYLVDHDSRKIFFLDPFQADSMNAWWEARGCNSMKHLGIEMEAQYWYFVNLYPDSISLSLPLIAELRDMTHHCIGDIMTSTQAITPFTFEYLEKILGWTSSMERNLAAGLSTIGTNSLLSRLLYSFYHSRYLHFHGEAHARLERDSSVYGNATNGRTIFIKIFSPFLFWAPYVYHQALQAAWVDGLFYKYTWKEAVEKLKEECKEFVLLGTVLLSANVGFLAIQSVDSSDKHYSSEAQIMSYLSIAATVGSILLGLRLLLRQTEKIHKADKVVKYLGEQSHPLLGVEILAILHSLPYALLMWAVAALLAAFAFRFFLQTTTFTRTLVGTVGGIVAGFVVLSIIYTWEVQPESNSRLRQRSDNKVITFISKFRRNLSNFGGKLHDISFEMPRINVRKPMRRTPVYGNSTGGLDIGTQASVC